MYNQTSYLVQHNGLEVDSKIEQVVQREKKRLLNFIRQRTPTVEDAEDILQDVFYELVESYRLMKPVEQLASWMFTVARNKITDLYRKKKPDSLEDTIQYVGEESDEPLMLSDILQGNTTSADDKMMNDLVMEVVAEALDELPKAQRDAFVMHELEDKTMQQIADEMNTSVKTVISRKRYAVLYMRERLKTVYEQFIND